MNPNWLALLIAICIICTGAAVAEGTQESVFPLWENGLSAQRPYEDLPEVDLTEKLGYMMFYPTNNSVADIGTKVLEIFFPRTDVSAGDGKISLLDKESGTLIASYPMSDGKHVAFAAASAKDLEWLGWETGMQALITLDASLFIDREYYVTFDKAAIVVRDYEIENPAMTTQRGWSFSTASNYGVEGLTVNEDGNTIVQIKLGGSAIEAYPFLIGEGDLNTDMDMLSENGSITIQASSGKVEWGIAFADANGNVLATYYN